MLSKEKSKWPYQRASCLEWRGALDKDGYGRGESSLVKGTSRAHRVFYCLFFGKDSLPQDVVLAHSCDNPKCFNPFHLREATQYENVKDMDEKGRRVNASSYVTHCPQGHPYDDYNTLIWADGKRRCRICEKERRKR